MRSRDLKVGEFYLIRTPEGTAGEKVRIERLDKTAGGVWAWLEGSPEPEFFTTGEILKKAD